MKHPEDDHVEGEISNVEDGESAAVTDNAANADSFVDDQQIPTPAVSRSTFVPVQEKAAPSVSPNENSGSDAFDASVASNVADAVDAVVTSEPAQAGAADNGEFGATDESAGFDGDATTVSAAGSEGSTDFVEASAVVNPAATENPGLSGDSAVSEHSAFSEGSAVSEGSAFSENPDTETNENAPYLQESGHDGTSPGTEHAATEPAATEADNVPDGVSDADIQPGSGIEGAAQAESNDSAGILEPDGDSSASQSAPQEPEQQENEAGQTASTSAEADGTEAPASDTGVAETTAAEANNEAAPEAVPSDTVTPDAGTPSDAANPSTGTPEATSSDDVAANPVVSNDPNSNIAAAAPQAAPSSFDDSTPLARELAEITRRRHAIEAESLPLPSAPRIFTVANQKGGVGKTTTTVNLAAALARAGARVLVIDLDPQGNASTALGVEHRSDTVSVYDVIVNDEPMSGVVQKSPEFEALYCVPATIHLAGAEIELVSMVAREQRLHTALDRFLDEAEKPFHYVFIDCPPSLGLLTINAFVAAREVLIPIQCEYYALEGLSQLLSNIKLIERHLNPKLAVSTILLTMYDGRTNLANQVAEDVREHFPNEVLATLIPRSVRISEAPSYGQSVISYDPTSPGSLSYLEAASEIARRGAPE